jgi:hypothetical protein
MGAERLDTRKIPFDEAEAAYQRGDLLEKRRELMEAWADWLGH